MHAGRSSALSRSLLRRSVGYGNALSASTLPASPTAFFAARPPPLRASQLRHKHTKTNSYRVPANHAHFTSPANHVGIRALSAEYVETGRTVVKQRKYIAKNPNVHRRQKHFKLYPGENVAVDKDTSLIAMCSGRVKFTHDTVRDVKIANVLPEAMTIHSALIRK
eukprot:g15916.t1